MEVSSDIHVVTNQKAEQKPLFLFSRIQRALLKQIPDSLNELRHEHECNTLFIIPKQQKLGWIEVVIEDPVDPQSRIKLRLARRTYYEDTCSDLSISFGRWDTDVEREAPVPVAVKAGDWHGVLGTGASKAWLHRSHGKVSEDASRVHVPKWVQTGDTHRINAQSLPAQSTPLYFQLQHAYDAVIAQHRSIDRIIWTTHNNHHTLPGLREWLQALTGGLLPRQTARAPIPAQFPFFRHSLLISFARIYHDGQTVT